ncbi:MAG: sensor histidine kinase [Streptosporangiales bacterium]|nr:sensor histidine kinase [Streptosporangiales bacterium]MBO0892135.1 sensor histidine kinase [Acidothermales bacterium]
MATLPATRPRVPAWVADVLIAVLAAAFQVRGTVFTGAEEQVTHVLGEPFRLGYVLLAVSGLALLLRRRWPVPVFAAVAAVNVGYYAAGYPDGPTWLALFVALYTVTAYGDGRRSLAVVLGGLGALTVGWLVTADLHPLVTAGWVFFRIGASVMAAALGESVRTRRVIADEAEARAERAERTREQEASRRVDAERLRIAREVHDTVAHAIAVINVQAGVGGHVLDRRPDRAREALGTIERTSARALHELRGTLGVLRAHGGQAEAGLDRLPELAELAGSAGLQVSVDADTAGPVPREVEHAAYRIVQEAITNAIRHAGPATVAVSVVARPDGLRVRVTDDGCGVPAGTDREGAGRGITGMRERAELLGGDLAAGPRAGGGYAVSAWLPFAAGKVPHP